MQEALTKGIIVSKRCVRRFFYWRIAFITDSDILPRNIFYKDPVLFKSQGVVDRYIDILAYTLGVQRAALNVVGNRIPFSEFFEYPTD